MPNFIVREKGKVEDESFNEDFVAFNKDYVFGSKLADNFKVSYAGVEVLVDLNSGKIFVGGVEVQLNDLPEGLTGFRPVNFKRNKATIGMVNGLSYNKVSYGAGWQATLNDVNYQRFILINEQGLWTLETKR
jgi:hypothetical protein